MRTARKEISEEKENGRIYTPVYIVENILDLCGYYGNNIVNKHVIDNSCGDGAFLCEIVRRYCEVAKKCGMNKSELASNLSSYVHGIEIEPDEHAKCIANLNEVAMRYGIDNVSWDVLCGNALEIHKYDRKMNFVVGNPPYVRIHNLGDSAADVKQFSFTQKGMTDLFIAFFEIGITMMSEQGTLGYITPSSYFSSTAAQKMRFEFVTRRLLRTIVNLRHYQAFSATTYTAITILKNGDYNQNVGYYQFDEKNKIPYFVDSLSTKDFYIGDNFYFSKKADLQLLKKIFSNKTNSNVSVKNGFATLCDDVFVGNYQYNSPFIIPVVKSSKGTRQQIIFPYNKQGKIVTEDELSADTNVYHHLLSNKDKLLMRSMDKMSKECWYAYGRSQAIGDTFVDKIAINSIIRTVEDLKLVNAPAGVGVYGGLYIICENVPLDTIINLVKQNEFITYIALLGKYKSGGYYSFSSKDLKMYIDYELSIVGGTEK